MEETPKLGAWKKLIKKKDGSSVEIWEIPLGPFCKLELWPTTKKSNTHPDGYIFFKVPWKKAKSDSLEKQEQSSFTENDVPF